RHIWDAMAEEAAGKERIRAALEKGVPWQDWLADPANLRRALEEAGAAHVEVREMHYPVSMTIAEFLAVRNNSLTARFLRTTLGSEGWNAFQERVAGEFHAHFQDPIDHVRDALIAI